MRRLELLIDTARELTQNTRYNATSGLSQKLFVEYFNHASASLNREITNAKSKFFKKSAVITVVSGQELYDWPKDIFLFNVDTMEYSSNGRNYTPLNRGVTKERMGPTAGYPFSYIPQGNGFILSPPQTSGTLRVNYIKEPSRLEKRSGKISAVTVANGVLSAMTINSAEASFDPTYINRDNYISVVDKFGVQKAKHIIFDTVDATSGIFTLSAFTMDDGDTIAVGDYVCAGYDSTNLPEYPTTAEDFLKKHVEYECKYGDSSKWSAEAKENIIAIAGQIITSFGIMTDDVVQIPIINSDYLFF